MLQFGGTIALFIMFANCQHRDPDAVTCSSQPVFNRNCGSNDISPALLNVNGQLNVIQGNSGQIGLPGRSGSKDKKVNKQILPRLFHKRMFKLERG